LKAQDQFCIKVELLAPELVGDCVLGSSNPCAMNTFNEIFAVSKKKKRQTSLENLVNFN
jgi:hypothetical protein